MRLRLVRENTSFDFFKRWKGWIGLSSVLMVLSLVAAVIMGLNFGIDFKGGTTIRTESSQPVDVAAYRAVLEPIGLGDISIAEVFDPTFDDDQNVAQVRIQAQEGQESVTKDVIDQVQVALQTIDPSMSFPAIDSVGPKVSGELIQSAVLAVVAALAVVLFYIWLRFEWQFAVGAVAALFHDVLITIVFGPAN